MFRIHQSVLLVLIYSVYRKLCHYIQAGIPCNFYEKSIFYELLRSFFADFELDLFVNMKLDSKVLSD